jgi:aerobic carbon-monoxide dehydrogenase large subunit
MAVTTMVGAKIHRREDPKLITGHGNYVDDMQLTGMVHMAVVRSAQAHAKILSVDLTAASKAPGVVAVYTARDFKKVISGGLPVTESLIADKKQTPNQFPIAETEAVYFGEPIAVVLAESRYGAADAAELVHVEYESLAVLVNFEKAMEKGSPTAHTGAPDNIAWDVNFNGGDLEAAFKESEVTVKERIIQQRVFPLSMEPRAVLADYVPFGNQLTVWTSSQVPHFIRLFLCIGLGMPESQIRVVAPDVGGGFGSKLRPYPEEYLAAAASKLSGRPVKWIEGRTENLQATSHGRGHIFDIEVGAKRDGTLLALKITMMSDIGAYVGVFGALQSSLAMLLSPGCYKWKAVHGRAIGVLTNKMSTDPYRGAGRPEAAHLVERAVDLVAQELKMDPADVRAKNFAEDFPFTSILGMVYDSGEYQKSLDKAKEIAGYTALRQKQADLRKHGRYLGIGLSTYVEICGVGPSAATAHVSGSLALVESSVVRVHPTGSVTVAVGTHSHGQGHDTTFAQIAADALGLPYANIEIRHGDTADTPFGYGTYGSRSLPVGGISINRSCQKVVEKAKKIAAHLLEAADEDVVFDQGQFYVKGSPDKRKAMGEVAFAAYGPGLPEGMENGLEAVTYFDPPNFTWPFGAHICVVEVDPETGEVDIQKYVAVDDCGNIINPMIVEGQIHGGVAQGIGQALFEEAVHDPETGTLKTGTLLDYSLPGIGEIPALQLDRTITPSPTNELGVKGVGEAGTIAASAAVINAIVDALSPFGIKHVDMPASPDRIWKQIQQAHQHSNGGKEARK